MKFILLLLPIALFSNVEDIEQHVIENIKAKQIKQIVENKVSNEESIDIIQTDNIGEKRIIEGVGGANNVYRNEYQKNTLDRLKKNIKHTTNSLISIYSNKNTFFEKYLYIAKLINLNGTIYDGFRYYDTEFYLNNKKTFDIYNRLSLLLLQKYDYYLNLGIDVKNQLETLRELTKTINEVKYEYYIKKRIKEARQNNNIDTIISEVEYEESN